MDLIERVQDWARLSISLDVTTAILRSEGFDDEDISNAYTAVVRMPGYSIEVERGIPSIVPHIR